MNQKQTLDSSSASDMDGATSLTLIQLVKSEDQSAWETLSRLYSPLTRFWCRKYGIGRDNIDDVVQDIFRSVHMGINRFHSSGNGGSFRAWLWTIARNRIKDHFKKGTNKNPATGGTDAQMQFLQIPESEPIDEDSELDGSGSLTKEALKIVRDEIKEQTFQAFWRSTIDDISPSAVSAELGISVDSVYQAKSRVLRRLRELLH